jgi:oxalate decarboxylase/phosphoglucose isomerase-like protein (cupin superfamily)
MGSLKKVGEAVARLFANKEVTDILFEDLLEAELDYWYYINHSKEFPNGTIRYKFTKITDGRIISITEWLEDDYFHMHRHTDCDEVCFVINGFVHSILDNLKRCDFQKLFYGVGVVHKIWGKKGTIISVKFDYKNEA